MRSSKVSRHVAVGAVLAAGLLSGVWRAWGEEDAAALPAYCNVPNPLDPEFLATLSWEQAGVCVEPVRSEGRSRRWS